MCNITMYLPQDYRRFCISSIVITMMTLFFIFGVTSGHRRTNHHKEDEEEEIDGEIPIYLHEQHLSDMLVGEEFGYFRRMARPVRNYNDTIRIEFQAGMMQIVDLHEKNEILVTRMWLTMGWIDHDLTWEPRDYGNLTSIRLHTDDLWSPDLTLYNTAESSFKIPLANLAVVRHNGTVTWAGPVLFRSSCFIDMSNFPFDRQNCSLKLGPWSWTTHKVDMVIKHKIEGHPKLGFVDMKRYWKSAEWELEAAYGVKANRHYETTEEDTYADVTYFLILRRLPLFYAVNTIVPCLEISVITIMTFLLPVGSFEKTILSISVLVALTVFLIGIISTVPPTSLVIPLLGKYLLSTTVVLTLAIIVSVVSVSIHYKDATTCKMPKWVRFVFMERLPRLLRMKTPSSVNQIWVKQKTARTYESLVAGKSFPMFTTGNRATNFPSFQDHRSSCFGKLLTNTLNRMRARGLCKSDLVGGISLSEYYEEHCGATEQPENDLVIGKDEALYHDAIESLTYICERIQRQDEEGRIRSEWKYVSTVLDRVFLIVYVIINIGTGLMFAATYHEEPQLPQ